MSEVVTWAVENLRIRVFVEPLPFPPVYQEVLFTGVAVTAAQAHEEPFHSSANPELEHVTLVTALDPAPTMTPPEVGFATPSPPFPTGRVPVTDAVRLILLKVFEDPLIVLFVSVKVLVSVSSVEPVEGIEINDPPDSFEI